MKEHELNFSVSSSIRYFNVAINVKPVQPKTKMPPVEWLGGHRVSHKTQRLWVRMPPGYSALGF